MSSDTPQLSKRSASKRQKQENETAAAAAAATSAANLPTADPKAASHQQQQPYADLVRTADAGMQPINLVTGLYGSRGERIRHVVYKGALAMPQASLDLLTSSTSLSKDQDNTSNDTAASAAKKTCKLPGLDSVVRPLADPKLKHVTLTDVYSTVIPGDPVTGEPSIRRTIAKNRVVTKVTAVAAVSSVTGNDIERIRGGGDEAQPGKQEESKPVATLVAATTAPTSDDGAAMPPPAAHTPAPVVTTTTSVVEAPAPMAAAPVIPLATPAPAAPHAAPPVMSSTVKPAPIPVADSKPAATCPTPAPVVPTPTVATPVASVLVRPVIPSTVKPAPIPVEVDSKLTATFPTPAPVVPTPTVATTPSVPVFVQPVVAPAPVPGPSAGQAAAATAAAAAVAVAVPANPTAQAVLPVAQPATATSIVATESSKPAEPAPVISTPAPAAVATSAATPAPAPVKEERTPAPAASAPVKEESAAPAPPVPVKEEPPAKPEVVGLKKRPAPQWEQHKPGSNDEMQVDPANKTVVPEWYKADDVSDLERTLLPEWFDESAQHRTKQAFMSARNTMMKMSETLGNRYITSTMVRRCIPGDAGSLFRLHTFLTTYALINEDAMNDSAPTPMVLQKHETKRQGAWDEQLRDNLMEAVVEQSSKRPKLEAASDTAAATTTTTAPLDWDAVAAKVGHGRTPVDCEREFLALPLVEDEAGPREGSITPDMSHAGASNETPSRTQGQRDMFRQLVDQSDPSVLRAVTEAALSATDKIADAQKAAVYGLVAGQAVQEARSHEESVSKVLSEIVDLRMQRLENRMRLVDEVEGMLDAERMALELERRDLYTARCRHWFGGP